MRVTELHYVDFGSAVSDDQRLAASCSLGADELRERLAAWRALRARSTGVQATPQGVILRFAGQEPLEDVVRLVALEAECCPFYRFELRVSGPARELEIDAGPDGHAAVEALLAIPS